MSRLVRLAALAVALGSAPQIALAEDPKWLLVIIAAAQTTTTNVTAGVSVATVEFQNAANCNAAVPGVKGMNPPSIQLTVNCVQAY